MAYSRLHLVVPVTAALTRQGPGLAGVGVGGHGRGGAVRQRAGHAQGQTASLSVKLGFEAGGHESVVGAGEVHVVPRAGIPRRKERRQEGKRAGREVARAGGGSYARLTRCSTKPAGATRTGCPATQRSGWKRDLREVPAARFRGKTGAPGHFRLLTPPTQAFLIDAPAREGGGHGGPRGGLRKTAAVPGPTFECGFAGPVLAPFSQASFLGGRPRLLLPALTPRLYSGLSTYDRTRVAPGLLALLRARARPGLPWCLPAPPPLPPQGPPAAVLRSWSAFSAFSA